MKEINWNFDNSYERLDPIFYKRVALKPVSSPSLVLLNEDLTKELSLNYKALLKDGLGILAGNLAAPGASLISQAYMGHQFGYLNMLGDGRAILIGEQINKSGKRFDLQYKGSGPTPFSRGGDGRASLGPMLRECLISEAMFHLNIPTTRTLSLVLTGQKVLRRTAEDGAILVRVASSHIRVGSFVYASHQGFERLREYADYTIERHFPHLKDSNQPYLDMFNIILDRQAQLISKWMLVGFVHGVMNTDNMSIPGETIDYGPCAFLDVFNPSQVYSSIDKNGRYAYNQQPAIGQWNLAMLGQALSPLISTNPDQAKEKLSNSLNKYWNLYESYYYQGLAKKLGLDKIDKTDYGVLNEFLELMYRYKLDYTNTFLDFTFDQFDSPIYLNNEFQAWMVKYKTLLEKEGMDKNQSLSLMKKSNPTIIPRNYWVERALQEAILGNYQEFKELLKALKQPYDHKEEKRKYSYVPQDMEYTTYCGT